MADRILPLQRNKRLIDRARNLVGDGKLTGDVLARLEAVLNNPTPETWTDASSIIINPKRMTTLWKAWIAIDPSAPKSGRAHDSAGRMVREWERIPDTFTLYRAIKAATKDPS